MMSFLPRGLLILIILTLALTACVPPATPVPPAGDVEAPATAEPPIDDGSTALPPAVEYDLGEATVVQERFPEDSRFRDMPVRLNGLIAAPSQGDGPFPVVVIIHGTHPGCPEDEMGVDRWPCDPEVERRNYSGFAYLASALAEQGYVVLVPNTNAEHTFGFGEPTAGERLTQLLDLHLQAVGEATAGGANDFGVALAGRADLSRLALFGHSRGGEAALALANLPSVLDGSQGYGPVAGVLQIAAARPQSIPGLARPCRWPRSCLPATPM
jgi:predicted dienelactone hydrolase